MSVLVRAKAISKRYHQGGQDSYAVSAASFQLRTGEFVALTGPSGSGKTTLAHMIGGLLRPTGGSLRVDDVELARMNDADLSRYRNRTVGFVFQNFNLLPYYNVIENVMVPQVIEGRSSAVRRASAMEYLRLVGLADKAKHRADQLSGGERQRVGIARALVNEPRLLIADEPTGNLDSRRAEEIMQLVEHLSRARGVTVLLVTHDAAFARRADRTMHIVDGVLAHEGAA